MRAMNHDVMPEPYARQSRASGEGDNEGEGCDERLVGHVCGGFDSEGPAGSARERKADLQYGEAQ
jgi:hypothetical protein